MRVFHLCHAKTRVSAHAKVTYEFAKVSKNEQKWTLATSGASTSEHSGSIRRFRCRRLGALGRGFAAFLSIPSRALAIRGLDVGDFERLGDVSRYLCSFGAER